MKDKNRDLFLKYPVRAGDTGRIYHLPTMSDDAIFKKF
jgi:hypothetical protein